MQLPKYDDSLLAMTSSIQKHFGVESEYASMPDLDKELSKGYKHVFLYLIDGLGYYNIEKLKNEMPFLYSKLVRPISSVYPSTTVAATTVACCGLPPVRTGWIGWHQYFKEFEEDYVLFLDRAFYDMDKKSPRNIEFDVMKYHPIWEKIADKGYYGSFIYPEFRTPEAKTFKDQCKMVLDIANDKDKEGYVYVYWDKLDTHMHGYGVESTTVKAHAEEIDNELKALSEALPEDTLLIVTADHGHVDIEYMALEEHPDLTSLFTIRPTVEARAMSFHIQEGKKEEFAELFNKYYGEYFVLFTHEEVIDKGLLGPGEESERTKEFLGDFLACATDKYCLSYVQGGPPKGNHAGMTRDEMTTPLIFIKKTKKVSGSDILKKSREKKNGNGKNFNKIVGKPKDPAKFARVNFNG